jgi:hypothetical protein
MLAVKIKKRLSLHRRRSFGHFVMPSRLTSNLVFQEIFGKASLEEEGGAQESYAKPTDNGGQNSTLLFLKEKSV